MNNRRRNLYKAMKMYYDTISMGNGKLYIPKIPKKPTIKVVWEGNLIWGEKPFITDINLAKEKDMGGVS